MEKLYFSSDYMEGAHPLVMERLVATNLEHTSGYGTDQYCEQAKKKILDACNCPDGDVFFLVGGTQTNATVISSILRPFQGVIAADTGHISCHEAGAIEHTGHKVITLPHENGKVTAQAVENYMMKFYGDDSWEHMVIPGMVYISHPTEYGTLYTKDELENLARICTRYRIPLYMDGARMAYALASSENDVTLQDIAKYCDAFYIGGTKCGAMFGEAVVLTRKDLIPHFFTMIKQSGALLAKGRLLGVQFDALFTDDLYFKLGDNAIRLADRLRSILEEKGYPLYMRNATNQVFTIMEDEKLKAFGENVIYTFWEKIDETHTAIRLCTGWATSDEDVDALEALL